MGIQDLLKGLKTYTRDGSVNDFRGQALAVDVSSWLHKSVYPIAEHFVETMERRKDQTGRVMGTMDPKSVEQSTKYLLKRCRELITWGGVGRILLVWDGKRCPLKVAAHRDREATRLRNLNMARQSKRRRNGKEAEKFYMSCIRIPEEFAAAVAANVQRQLRYQSTRDKIEMVHAPYEADAQLVHLCVEQRAQAIVTEDSDVLVYSAACQQAFPILYKLNAKNGTCQILSMDWLLNPPPSLTDPKRRVTDATQMDCTLNSFIQREKRHPGKGCRLFVQACVLAGCDYAPNQLSGVGMVSAFRHMQHSIHRSADKRFRHVLQQLPAKAKKEWTNPHRDDDEDATPFTLDAYAELLAKSEAVFFYHPVLDTPTGRVRFFNRPAAPDVVDSEESFLPSLQRFGDDWSFLAAPDILASILTVNPNVDTVARPRESPKETTGRFSSVSTLTKKTGRRVYNDQSEAIIGDVPREVKIINNPYQKSNKRPREDDREAQQRRPFVPKSPNHPPNSHITSAPQHKRFSRFSYADQKENPSHGDGEKIISSRKEYRFVKPLFMDGKRVNTRKQALSLLQPPSRMEDGPRMAFEYSVSGASTDPCSEIRIPSLGLEHSNHLHAEDAHRSSTSQGGVPVHEAVYHDNHMPASTEWDSGTLHEQPMGPSSRSSFSSRFLREHQNDSDKGSATGGPFAVRSQAQRLDETDTSFATGIGFDYSVGGIEESQASAHSRRQTSQDSFLAANANREPGSGDAMLFDGTDHMVPDVVLQAANELDPLDDDVVVLECGGQPTVSSYFRTDNSTDHFGACFGPVCGSSSSLIRDDDRRAGLRRVTLDSPERSTFLRITKERSSQHARSEGGDSNADWFPRGPQFDIFDGASSGQFLTTCDDYARSNSFRSEESFGAVGPLAPAHVQPPKPKRSIGPAKTDWSRFQSAKPRPLEAAFQRQRERAGDLSSIGIAPLLSQKSRRRHNPRSESRQSTMLMHFSLK